MSYTSQLNKKANIKQPTNADLVSTGQPVINRYEADSTAGQTIINLPFYINTNDSDAFMLFVNGQLLTEGASSDFTFTNVDASGFSNQVTLTSSLIAGIPITAVRLGTKKDRTDYSADARFSDIYSSAANAFQPYVDESSKLTAVTSAPGTTQFLSSIVKRADIPNIKSDLKARMGIERVMTQQIYQLQNEFGPNGEQVFGAVNDDRNQIRFVGNWSNLINNYGSRAQSATNITDYVEITFYGTGLNLLISTPGGTAKNIVASVDGGSEGSNLVPAGSDILGGRNYSANVVIPVVSGLTLGVHTVKLRNNTASTSFDCCGFEILNEASTINVRPGTGYSQMKSIPVASESNLAYNSSFDLITKDGSTVGSLGTKGGRVVAYLDTDGTIKKRATAVNTSQLNLTSADHTYEEVIRTYSFREFGAGRADDFSTLTTSTSNRAFTLDDGTTTLVGSNVFALSSTPESTTTSNASSNYFHTITFVGTGIDIVRVDSAAGTSPQHDIIIDGINVGSVSTSASTIARVEKLVSGLPYGTHTLKINRAVSGGINVGIVSFNVYGPKKPSIPSNAIELADYNVIADFIGTAATGTTESDNAQIPTGVLLKNIGRESIHVGTWSVNALTYAPNANISTFTATNSDYIQYTFFGTGVSLHLLASGSGTYTAAVSLVGESTPTVTARANCTGGSGTLSSTSTTSGQPVRAEITGLSLGLHTIRVTKSSGAGAINIYAFDIITPIHSYKRNIYADFQNTLSVGSNAISDSRVLTPVKESLPAQKAWSQAVGINPGASATSTSFVPVPDMSVTIKSNGGPLQINYTISMSCSTVNQYGTTICYIDGVAVAASQITGYFTASYYLPMNGSCIVPVPAGVHKIDMYWQATSGTMNAYSTYRTLTVKEL